MEKQHLTYFKIENFKRFDSFEMNNLGQFNLIVGDNNVGKTSVLEALTFDVDATRLLTNFWTTISSRGNYQFQKKKPDFNDILQTRFWESIFKRPDLPIKISINAIDKFSLVIELRPNLDLVDTEKEIVNRAITPIIPSYWLKVSYMNDANQWVHRQMIPAYFEGSDPNITSAFVGSYIPYIPSNLNYDFDLLNIYYLYVNPNKESRREIENNLKLFISNLEELRPHKLSPNQEVLGVSLLNSNSILPLPYFGEGTVKYTRFLLEIFLAQDQRLMIDEIGSGIHFTRLKEYWKVIIRLCAKYNVQLFATTHSLECQQAFIEALEEPEMQQYQEDARNISVIENKRGEVKAVTYDFEQFEYALNIGFNTRGGKA
ncbi:AAA family ATPase [Spirosoma pomorum]